ncbi:hypothetical protein, partial [Mesorhizobium sp. M7A.F.Ca.CA.004.02.1.1]|uniref:hypothetical protein n=1 Tax=Mesorhizobium sp. M7A.F.Ca.CA.004.02.1.1 TaxID=2496690 RepID=UPI000FD2A709
HDPCVGRHGDTAAAGRLGRIAGRIGSRDDLVDLAAIGIDRSQSDAACYAAKAAGRGCVSVASDARIVEGRTEPLAAAS